MHRRKPQFIETLSFNAVDLIIGETLNLRHHAIPISAPKQMGKESFKKLTGDLSAGLFGGSGNQNIPIPNQSAASVLPQPEDLVNFPFRFISATIVGGDSWKATNFTKEGVLKASLPLFNRIPIFTDHATDASNWAGIVTDEYWQDAFKAPDGTQIPGGINGNASIDSKSNFNLVRGIALGAIGSNSVTVRFNWQPSHTFDNIQQFYEQIGNFHKDGKMITRDVNEVTAYFESSMLFSGADPFAKKLDAGGNPIQVDRTSVYFSKANPVEKTAYETNKRFEVIDEDKEILLSLSKSNNYNPLPQPNSNTMNKFLLAFVQAFGTQLNLSFAASVPETLTEAQEGELTTALAKLGIAKEPTDADKLAKQNDDKIVGFAKGLKFVNDKNEVSSFDPLAANGDYIVMLKTAFDTNTTEFGKLKTENEKLEPLATLGTSFVAAKREETVRLYKLAAGDKADAAVETMIKEAKPEALDGLLKQYGGEVGIKFAATCSKCGTGDHIDMRSSFATPPQEATVITEKPVDFAKKYRKNSLFTPSRPNS